MADRGLGYWLQWPHTRRDHAVAATVLTALALAMAVTDSLLAALVAAIAAVVLATKVLWLRDDGEQAGAGERSAGQDRIAGDERAGDERAGEVDRSE